MISCHVIVVEVKRNYFTLKMIFSPCGIFSGVNYIITMHL